MTVSTLAPTVELRLLIQTLSALVAAYPIDEASPVLDGAVREVTRHLRLTGQPADPHEVHDCMVALVDVSQQLADLADDPDTYLASMRRQPTVEEQLRVEADLRAQRQQWLDRLVTR
jgi:hypothetical protein